MIKFISILFVFTIFSPFVSKGFATNEQNNNYAKTKSSYSSSSNTLVASISANDTAVCKGDASPIITFKVISGGTSPYTFYYNKNSVSGIASSASGSGSATITVDTSIPGTYTITLDSISYAGLPAEVQTNLQVKILVGDFPDANFSFIDNVCSGKDVTFTPTLNDNSRYSYVWDFGDNSGTSTESSPTHNFFPVGSSGSTTFNVSLTIKDKLTGCTNSQSNSVTIFKGPDTKITSDAGNSQYFNGFFTFSACVSDLSKVITFYNSSSTTSTDLSYTIDWGDGTPIYTSNSWTSVTHNYARGAWNLKYTITSSVGCSTVTKIYKVFLGSNPGVGLSSPGNTAICAGEKIIFPVSNTEGNPPGTIYEFTVNDGSATVTFTHPPPASIEHVFTKTSCGAISFDGTTYYQNAFSARITATNPCSGSYPSASQVMPIYVTSPPQNSLKSTKSTACINETVNFNFLTQSLTIANLNGTCTSPNVVWSVSPNTNYNIISGALGNDFGSDNYSIWNNGTENINLSFTQAGTYVVKVRSGTACSLDQAVDTICITAPTTPTFTLDKNEGCFPLTINTNNITSEVLNCGKPIDYKWSIISFNPGTCGTVRSYTMTDGANIVTNGSSGSKNTTITFQNPGTYTLQLSATNNCGPNSKTETIIVKAPPKVSINSIATVCQTFPETIIKPTASIQNCGKDALVYDWSFSGGNPAASNSDIPGEITYNTPGTYTITLKVTNECGVSTTATSKFTINPTPVLTSTASDQFKCAGQLSDLVDFTSNTPNTIFRWTNSNTQIGLAANGIGDISPFTLKNTTSSNITATITVIPTLNGCDGAPQTFTITVKPTVYFTSQPVSSSVCLNGIAQTLSVTYANGTGTPQYQWYSNTTNNNATGTAIASATSSTYDPPTNTIGIIYYYCILTLPNDICGTIVSNVASVSVSEVPTIDKNPIPTQQICVGGIIDPLTVSSIHGVGTPTYQWYSNNTNSNTGGVAISGANSSSYTPPAFNSSGNYYFYVVINYSASACGTVTSDVAEIIVVSDPVITTQPLATQTLCQNSAASPLNVAASGGLGNYKYQWYVNTANSTVSATIIAGANADTYTPPTSTVGTLYYFCLITQDGLGCAATSNISQVKITESPTFTTQPLSSTLCLGSTAPTLSVTYKNGIGTAAYQWYSNTVNNNSTGSAISGEINSTYTPPVSNVGTMYYYCIISFSSGGCKLIVSNTAKIIINQYPVITDYTAHIGSGTTFSVTPSTIIHPTDIVPAGTTYTWATPVIFPSGAITGGSAQSTPQTGISQLLNNTTTTTATATYTVTPSANGCIGNAFQIIVTVDPPIKTDSIITHISCFGANNGSIEINISGGTPPYNILWNGPNGFSSTSTAINGLVPGTYLLKITDSYGIVYNKKYVIKEPADITFTSAVKKDITCYGANNGEISVSVSGGNTPYKYAWEKDGNLFSNSGNITGLQQGNYHLSVTDANNCGPKTLEFTITEPAPIVISTVSKTDLLCFGDSVGNIIVNVTGGTLKQKSAGVFDYDYFWTGPNGFTSRNKNISNLKAGNYTLLVKDSMNCEQTSNITVAQPDEIKIKDTTRQISCFGANDGSIKIEISGGVSPYIIEWNNFAKGDYLVDLGPGTYTVTITDNNGCQATKSILIKDTPYSINPVVNHVSCYGSQDGSINLNLVTNSRKFTIVWDDNPLAGSTRNRLKPGTYTVRLTDSLCTVTRSFTILEPLPISVSSAVTDAFSCNNPNSGAINLVVSGGTEPYTYLWSNGQTSKDITNIPAGNYIVSVTDLHGCQFSKQFEVKRQPVLNLTTSIVNDFNCVTGELKQVCTAVASGGIAPYTYSWSSGSVSGINNQTMETSKSGIYTLSVTDSYGCSATYSFEIDIPIVGIDYLLIDCNNKIYRFDAHIPFGQPTDYTFYWDFGDGQTSTSQNVEHKYSNSGTYKVTLKLKRGSCETNFEKNVDIIAQPTLLLNKIPIVCSGDSIMLHVAGADYYRWFDGSTADSLMIKKAGDYSVEGTNIHGCSSVLNFTVKNFDNYNFTILSNKDEISTDDPQVQLWTQEMTNAEYLWDFGDGQTASGSLQNHIYNITGDGYFDVNLQVINPNGCIENATKRIWIKNNILKNTFSPNGDGVDDVYMKGWYTKIYNRNGVLIYEGKDGWDGKYKGKDVSNDTYFVVLYYPTPNGVKTNTGYITVIR